MKKFLYLSIFLFTLICLPVSVVGQYSRANNIGSNPYKAHYQRVSAGGYHNLEIRNGELWAWGNNEYGQLGDGSSIKKNYPVKIGTDNNWNIVSGGFFHSTAIKSDGTLWAWGDNKFGQLGNGTATLPGSDTPVQVETDNQWISISSGFDFNLAIKSDGTLWAWGKNQNGQLGDNTTDYKYSPTQIGTDNKWIKVFAGFNFSLAIKSDGTLWAWGLNDSGQLGDGTDVDRHTPTRIGTATNWVSIAAGMYHSIALRSDGTLWTWGLNNSGQLGDGTYNNRYSPTQIGTERNWTEIVGTGSSSIALKSNGTLWGLGSDYGLTPSQIGTDNNWVTISGRIVHCVAVKSDGSLWTWGNNFHGQIGDGTDNNQSSPVLINTLNEGWVNVSMGDWHTLALRADGTLWAWGNNEYGQLGIGVSGSGEYSACPIQVGIDNDWISISSGGSHSIAIKSNGTLWAWGLNTVGQLGDGSWAAKSSPTQIGTDNTWACISAGADHSLAIKTNGTLWAWGWNNGYQLGDGTTTSRNTPIQIGSSSLWVSVSAGFSHSLGLRSNGSVWGWGQRVTITGNQRTTPGQVISGSYTSIATGNEYLMAINSLGELYWWGNDPKAFVKISSNGSDNWIKISNARTHHRHGIKSDGTLWYGGLWDVPNSGPWLVQDSNQERDIIAISSGIYNTAIIKSNRLTICTAGGENSYGQLGNGTTDHGYNFICSTTSSSLISSHPQNTTICSGANTSFNITASGSPSPTYQWQLSTNGGGSWNDISNGGVYSNTTTATLNITGATSGMHNYQYRCVVSNSCGTATSNPATLTVNSIPSLPSPIVGENYVCKGTTYTYSVENVDGVTYTWTVSSGLVINSGQGTNSISVTVNSTSSQIYVTPSNSCGNGLERYFSVYAFDDVPPQISDFSNIIGLCEGITVTYSVGSYNPNTLYYHWEFPSGWVINSGQGTINVNVTTGSGSGNIIVTPSNACGNGPSTSRYYKVYTSPPNITSQPQSSTTCIGDDANFTVIADDVVSYDWQVSTDGGNTWNFISNFSPYSGANTPSLNITSPTWAMNNYQYRCWMHNWCFNTYTNPATLTISDITEITSPPVDVEVCVGDDAVFTVESNYSQEYIWQKRKPDAKWEYIYTSLNTGAIVSTDIKNSIYGTHIIYTRLGRLRYQFDEFDNCCGIQLTNSGTITGNISLAVNNDNNIAYIAYSDPSKSNKASVIRVDDYNNQIYGFYGDAGFSEGTISFANITLSPNGEPYVVYADNAFGNAIVVKKYDSNIANWATIGSEAFSTGEVAYTKIMFDKNGTLYVAYQDIANDGKATVMKYDAFANKWEAVGSAGFTDGSASYIDLKIDFENNLHIAFSDGGQSGRASAMKFDGSAWNYSGSAGFSSGGSASEISLEIDYYNMPNVLFVENNKPTLMRLDLISNNWVNVVNPAFTPGSASYVSLDMSPEGLATVVFRDHSSSFRLGVMVVYEWELVQYNSSNTLTIFNVQESNEDHEYRVLAIGACGTDVSNSFFIRIDRELPTIAQQPVDVEICPGQNATFTTAANNAFNYQWQTRNDNWEDVGNKAFSQAAAFNTNSDIDNNGNVYTVFVDEANGYRLTVMTYDSTKTWKVLGAPGFTLNYAYYPVIKIDNNNIPSVVFSDQQHGGRISVMQFVNDTWQYLGSPGFSESWSYVPDLVFDDNNIPYVIYNDGNYGYRALVKRCIGEVWQDVGSNPVSVGEVWSAKITKSNSNRIYVAYTDSYNDGRASVKYFDGSDWVNVGIDGFTPDYVSDITISIDDSNNPWISYRYSGIYVEQFNGSNWVQYGDVIWGGTSPTLTIAENKPYIAYYNSNIGGVASVVTYDNSMWNYIGQAAVSDGQFSDLHLTKDKQQNLYLTYRDVANGDKATVRVFEQWADIDDETNTSLTFENVQQAQDGIEVRCEITGKCSNNVVATLSAFIRVQDLPISITQQPLNQWACEGSSVMFEVNATNASTYQWQKRVANAEWDVMGSKGFTPDGILYPSIITNSNNTAFVSFMDFDAEYKASVMYFNGSNWVYTNGGKGLSNGEVHSTSLANYNNLVYIAYSDDANGGKATVKMFDGSSWSILETEGFTLASVDYLDITIDQSGIPYVVFKDYSQSGKVSVMRFHNGYWEYVGVAGISSSYTNYTTIAVNSLGEPYILFRDGTMNDRARVMKYNGSSWNYVREEPISSGLANELSITIDQNNYVYVAYQDADNDNRAVVKMNYYWDSEWYEITFPGFGEYGAESISLNVDNTNTLHLSYIDYADMLPTVMKFQSWNWIAVGKVGFTEGPVSSMVTTIDNSGNVIAFFEDWDEGFLGTAMTFSGWENIVGANAPILSLTNIQLEDHQSEYRCVLSNLCGSVVNSNSALLYVEPNSTIVQNPESTEVCSGNIIGFWVGTQSAWSWRWQVDTGSGFVDLDDDANHSGVFNSYLEINTELFMNGYLYRCAVNGNCGLSYSEPATLNVYDSAPEQPTAIIGDTYMCNDSYAIYSIAPVPEANYYYWNVPNNAYVVSGQGTTEVVVYFGKAQGTISVSAINNCGYSDAQMLNVTALCTKLKDQYCGTTVETLSDALYAESISGALNYEWELVSQTNGAVLSLVRDRALARFSMFMGVQYGTTYSVRVRALLNGQWTNWGPSCEITTPAASYPTTRVRDKHCGTTLSKMTDAIYCYKVDLATDYWWEFTSLTDGSVIDYVRGSDVVLARPAAAGLSEGTTYSIRIRPFVDGSWRSFGASCEVTMPGTASRGVNDDEINLLSSSKQESDIDEIVSMTHVNIFPNPTNKLTPVSVVIDGLNSTDKTVSIEVTDMVGKKVYEKKAENNGGYVREYIRFNSDIASGSYLISITSSTEKIIRKIVIQ
jgi:alpha-tubulin suppressor-like RCC1 family protein